MVLIFSLLLLIGMVASQTMDLSAFMGPVHFLTSACLAYIMLEVGVEFSRERKPLASYGKDLVIAASAAIVPAVLWIAYFFWATQSSWKPALLAGLSAAPTSAGVLFAMLSAAGLSATWVFKKARVLAVLDDLVAILLLVPLEILIHGFDVKAITAVVIIVLCVGAAFRCAGALKWPISQGAMILYAVGLSMGLLFIHHFTGVHLEVLIPAFMLGCLLSGRHHDPVMPQLDSAIKGLFMLLVGLSLPKIALGGISIPVTIGHVVLLTILANLGKLFLVFCYSKEATFKERLALGVAMFPRGEVGAAVLLIGIGYGLAGYENSLAVISLGLNLVMTGLFIWIVIRLLKQKA